MTIDFNHVSASSHKLVGRGTISENTKLPLTVWFLAMYLLTQAKNNVAALVLTRHLGVCYRTAWLIQHKLLESRASAKRAGS